MELQEKVSVSIFTEVDKDTFLRDIYPEVREIWEPEAKVDARKTRLSVAVRRHMFDILLYWKS